MRRFRVDLLHHADDLLEFAHELGPVLQPPGRVHQHDVGVKLAGARQRVEGEPGRVARPARVRQGRNTVRRAQMRNCSIAAARKVSPAASTTVFPSAPNLAASLPMVVVLPEPLTPTTRMTNGRLLGSITSGRATGASARSTSAARTRLTSSGLDPLLVAPAGDRLANAGRRAQAKVGLDQHVLEIVEVSGVELALGEDVGDAPRDVRSTSARGPIEGAQANFASARKAPPRRSAAGSAAGGSASLATAARAAARSPRPRRRTSGAAGRISLSCRSSSNAETLAAPPLCGRGPVGIPLSP